MNISIIIPVYNVPQEYLRSCFESLVAQTMQNCEFVVISDGAPKMECSICEEYAAKDSRFKFFKCEHAGVSAARNFGLERALGEYITFVDSDDCVAPNFLETLFFLAQLHQVDVVCCSAQNINEAYKIDGSTPNTSISKMLILCGFHGSFDTRMPSLNL